MDIPHNSKDTLEKPCFPWIFPHNPKDVLEKHFSYRHSSTQKFSRLDIPLLRIDFQIRKDIPLLRIDFHIRKG